MNKLFRFFFPKKHGLKIEAITQVEKTEDGLKVHREFHTFRAFATHYFYEFFINPFRAHEAFKHFSMRQILQIGAIAFDAVTSSSSASFSHTVTGFHPALTVGTATTASNSFPSAITYNSVSMTNDVSGVGANNAKATMWSLTLPDTGSNTVSITGAFSFAGAISFSGANPTSAVDATGSGSGAGDTASASITTTTSNAFLVDAMAAWGGSQNLASSGAGQTTRWASNPDTTNTRNGSTKQAGGAGGYTMSWSRPGSAGNPNWGVAVVAVAEDPTISKSTGELTPTSGGGWINITDAFTDNATCATANDANATGTLQDFGIGFGSQPVDVIDGIEVVAQIGHGTASSAHSINFDLSWDGGSTWTSTKNMPAPPSTSCSTASDQTLGSSTDTWGRTWAESEFSNANFRVRGVKPATGASVDIDVVKVNVYYSQVPSFKPKFLIFG